MIALRSPRSVVLCLCVLPTAEVPLAPPLTLSKPLLRINGLAHSAARPPTTLIHQEVDPPMSATRHVPDAAGRFGPFGGRYVPETLTRALDELAAEYEAATNDAGFQAELAELFRNYVGRPSPLYHAKRLSEKAGGAQIYLKREDLNHTGAHKINNTLGQTLLTLRMGKPARDRRNGRRPAWSRHGDGLCALRLGVRRVYGRRGHSPAKAECVQHADDGRGSAAGFQRFADAERRH